jgi:hypothetical protein
MPEWAASLIVGMALIVASSLGFIVHLAMEVATLKERVRSLGQQLTGLPKRKGDSDRG